MRKYLLTCSLLCAFNLPALAEETAPYTWAHTLTFESLSNLQGGVEKGTRNLANLDLTLAINTESAGWWGQGSFFVYVLGDYGKPPSALTGDSQVLSNIEADNNVKLYQFWYEHSFADGAVQILAGLHDYNSTFYSLRSAGLFSLSSFGIGPETSQVGPSIFPTTATTLLLKLTDGEQYLLLATYDGIPGDPAHPRGTHIMFKKTDGLFNAAEWGFTREKDYKIALGGWKHTAEVENPINGNLSDSNSGFYIIGEKYFTENLAAFFQYGRADSHKNQLDTYTGLGLTYSHFWAGDDAIGLGYARAENSPDFLVMNPDLLSAETIVELTYYLPVIKNISMQASLYSIEHPSMSPNLDNSVALGLRLYLEF
jgi:porin